MNECGVDGGPIVSVARRAPHGQSSHPSDES